MSLPARHKKPQQYPLEYQLVGLCLVAAVPLLVLCIWTMIAAQVSVWLLCLTIFLSFVLISFCASQIYTRSVYRFRSLSNLIEAMLSGDYSLRARSTVTEGALDQVAASINALSQRLLTQRQQWQESQFLLRTIMQRIDVAVIALDESGTIVLTNSAADSLITLASYEQQQHFLDQVQFAVDMQPGEHSVRDIRIGQRAGRYKIHVEHFRESGRPHILLFITDVHNILRSEQTQAWQNLVRVISHEINNSLTPISSISATLGKGLNQQDIAEDLKHRLIEGLNLINQRAKNLSAFSKSYQQLAKLPPPQPTNEPILPLIKRVTGLFPQQLIHVQISAANILNIDKTQFEQVLINLIKNAVEATADINKPIQILGSLEEKLFVLRIRDSGSGISNPANLFVPFYSTKKDGSGIGLLLSRQIIEGHQGRLNLVNNSDLGSTAIIELPIIEYSNTDS